MEEKKTVFDYLGQVMIIFGFSMLLLNILCLVTGSSARDISSIFSLGSRGISVQTAFQFLAVSLLITGARILFFTDLVVKKMPVPLRTVCMLTTVVAIIILFVVLFQWFPVNAWQPWVMFFLCFVLSFAGSYFIMSRKEKEENKRLEEALWRLKGKKESGNTRV